MLTVSKKETDPLSAPTGAPLDGKTNYQTAVKDTKLLSGPHWVKYATDMGWKNSVSIEDLSEPFRTGVKEFKKALEDAGVKPLVSTTKRSKVRAWLMHHCWAIANGGDPPKDDPHDTGIIWDHGDKKKTQSKAEAMRDKFHMKYKASLTSNHISGNAIDWKLTWSGELKIKNKAGEEVTISSSPKNGLNKELSKIGATFGVHKLFTNNKKKPDEPHWSSNGN